MQDEMQDATANMSVAPGNPYQETGRGEIRFERVMGAKYHWKQGSSSL